mmetsp:Transcript_6345/g.14351  ORF Transcript_6345/g.14351 Transcript_6345/m.14351 type:complete len:193 (-) Transcript_6345:6356-6934(-)
MRSYNHQQCGILSVLLVSLPLYNCQHRLHILEEEASSQAATSQQVPNNASKTSAQIAQPPQERKASDVPKSTVKKQKIAHVILQEATQSASIIHSTASSHITQENVGQTMLALSSQNHATASLASTAQPSSKKAVQSNHTANKEDSSKATQRSSPNFRHWFQAFAEAVDDEKVLYEGRISDKISRLIQEGQK